ncbi:DUF3293 domain-containing protein [Hyphomonas sp.]|uniref:DUF3293 domain-containing protein n=1 Tax=Hyphomonas sp. TaxID=87 RepID=UPI0025C1FF5F|nr:DUF3293 domain-containing protein [Hyphomonas sp.]
MAQSEISDDKIKAYEATHYRIGSGTGALVLRIGQHCPALSTRYGAICQRCGVFITAYNPFGQAQSDEANISAHIRLRDHLRTLTPEVIDGDGTDPTGLWPPEESYFAFGISEATARLLGRDFHQDAVVWVSDDAIPRLILLR